MYGRVVAILLLLERMSQVLRMDALCGTVGLLVPPLRHEQIMKELHDTHPGITLIKALACSLVWWPNIDADLERMVQSCSVCFAPPKHFCILENIPSPLHVGCICRLCWPPYWYNLPYLIVVNAFSKWAKVDDYHSHSLI